ncbi:MAG TPA: DoxX family protein [Urbifossiella sp.]|jgi:hypothetical protein|nr:DoxX family protein [Urbifossiella sp.]
MTSTTFPAAPSRAGVVGYWVCTGLVAANLALGGVWDMLRTEYVRGVIEHLGYPVYFLVILGFWKLPGAVVVLAPGLPRLKEWVYAGAVFTYTGAVTSHLAVGDGTGETLPAAIMSGLAIASWGLRPPSRRSPPACRAD